MRKRTRKDPLLRFFAKVEKTEYCWLWTAGCNGKKGYGMFRPNGPDARVLAHRFSYQIAYGPIPPGAQVCHRCDTPRCVNPLHLFLGTNADNINDSVQKGRRVQKIPFSERQTIANSTESNVVLAKRYGVDKSSIWALKKKYGPRHSRAPC